MQEEAGRALFIRTDVTLETDIATCIDLAVSEFGSLDVMVNNAGIIGAVGPCVPQQRHRADWRANRVLITPA